MYFLGHVVGHTFEPSLTQSRVQYFGHVHVQLYALLVLSIVVDCWSFRTNLYNISDTQQTMESNQAAAWRRTLPARPRDGEPANGLNSPVPAGDGERGRGEGNPDSIISVRVLSLLSRRLIELDTRIMRDSGVRVIVFRDMPFSIVSGQSGKLKIAISTCVTLTKNEQIKHIK